MRMGGTLAPGNIRWQPEPGGATLADIGCYLINVFTPALDHFHDCLLDGAAPMLPNTDAIATARVMAAAAESARTGRTVHLDRIRD